MEEIKTLTMMQARKKCHLCKEVIALGMPVSLDPDDNLVHPSCLYAATVMRELEK